MHLDLAVRWAGGLNCLSGEAGGITRYPWFLPAPLLSFLPAGREKKEKQP